MKVIISKAIVLFMLFICEIALSQGSIIEKVLTKKDIQKDLKYLIKKLENSFQIQSTTIKEKE